MNVVPKQLSIRLTNPSLYHSLMTLSLMKVALAVNFWTSNPTFNPYGISKNVIGVIFFLLGASQIVFLNLPNLRMVRIVIAGSIMFMFWWGVSNMQQAFAGEASFQLPILYIALAVLQVPLLVETPGEP